MLKLDLEIFERVACWNKLPDLVRELDLRSTAVDPRFPGCILPCFEEASGEAFWYAAASTPQEWRYLSRLLLAYAGPTVTDFTGRSDDLNSVNAVEACFVGAGVYAAVRLKAPAENVSLAARALKRLVQSHALRPAGGNDVPRSTQSILARIEMSLAAGDRETANALLEVLRAEWRLDALNLRFVNVRILAHFRDWSAIAHAPWLPELCEVRKPSAIAEALLEALYESHFGPARASDDERNETFGEIRSLVLPLMQQVLPGSAAAASFAPFLTALSSGAKSGDVESVQRQVLAAAESLALETQRQAVEKLSALGDSEKAQALLPAPIRSALELISATDAKRVSPKDWIEWLSLLGAPDWGCTIEFAQAAASEWPLSKWTDPVAAKMLADSILQVEDGIALERLAICLPVLVRWVRVDKDYPRAGMKRVYDALLTQLTMLEARGQPEREAALAMFEGLLTIGCNPRDYGRLLDDMGALVDVNAGRTTAYWSLDLAEIVLRYPDDEGEARIRLLSRILGSLQSCLQILSVIQRSAYKRVASIAGWPALAEESPSGDSGDISAALDGKIIAIYTLNESAARQAEAVLLAIAPGSRIELAHDHVASSRLERLAKNADIFVMVANAAKHAAYDCIVRSRTGQTLVYAAGTGFCSIVRAVESACVDTRAPS